MHLGTWDYLILTASNERQAEAYARQLAVRQSLGLLGPVRQTIVVPDPGGRRVGSGGSTICCLLEVLRRESAVAGNRPAGAESWLNTLRRLRILIIHAGGDSRRLPAYGPCGKAFVPLPGPSDSALGTTLFDRQLPVYMDLPPLENQAGQMVITAGDVLLDFDPSEVHFASEGFTGLGCKAPRQQAARHGVYCPGANGQVRLFLQKPSAAEQHRRGAVDAYGQTVLDIGVVSFDAATAVKLLQLCEVRQDSVRNLAWSGPMADAIVRHGLDFYREICCALGTETTLGSYRASVRANGSVWDDRLLTRLYRAVAPIPCRVQVLPYCGFLHFGTTRQVITSGQQFVRRERVPAENHGCLSINNSLGSRAALADAPAWVEGCRIEDELALSGDNVVVGVDIREPLRLPAQACLDVLPGRNREGQTVHFVRCYHEDDHLGNALAAEITLCGRPVAHWLASARASFEDIWDPALPPDRRNGWNARLFPAERGAAGYRRWLWMLEPARGAADHFRSWRRADRYSLEEMAALADQEAFHRRRAATRGDEIGRSLQHYLRGSSSFSAADLAHVMAQAPEPEAWVARLVAEARRHFENGQPEAADEAFAFSRIMHTLGSALLRSAGRRGRCKFNPARLSKILKPADAEWLTEHGFKVNAKSTPRHWASRAHEFAFEGLEHQIVHTGKCTSQPPQNSLRSDEIVWGRAPVRLDLAGGWSDTPPYCLEHGGCVLNAAVTLYGQPPIQVYARLTREPRIRIRSIDLGTHVDIPTWDDLLDSGSPTGEFSLAKAALVISGFVPRTRTADRSLRDALIRFGGGLELTTLAAIPKGSGLGTSSIMGAVLLAVIHRIIGKPLAGNDLFHAVLRLEQTLTTGGGWQDQIGGSVGGVKLITTQPGLVPDAAIRYVPADLLDPKTNRGQTLLYYTGMTRLAKNILQQVVGRYLDRDRPAMATLRQIRALAPQTAEAMARKDLPAFGRLIDVAWRLNKQLDPNSSSEEIEELLARACPYIHGAKLLGAGGGGFLLLVCKSPEDAGRLRAAFETDPPNALARFFDFEISDKGLEVSAC